MTIITNISGKISYALLQNCAQNCVPFLSIFSARRFSNFNSLRNEHVYSSDVPPLSLPNLDACNALFPRWIEFGNKEALECAYTGKILTYNELLNISMRWCAKLKDLEVAHHHENLNKRIAILSPNVLEYFPILMGTLANGWSMNTINTNYKAGEIRHQLLEVRPQHLIVHQDFENLAVEALGNDIKSNIITIGRSNMGRSDIKEILYDENGPRAKEISTVSPSSEALILFSSGTTGRPKGVVLSHQAITNNIQCFGHKDYDLVGPSDTISGLMPFYHAYGMNIIMFMTLYKGARVLVSKGFDPNTFGGLIRKHKIETLHLVPTLLNFAINSPLVSKEDLASVRCALIGGAPVLSSAASAFREKVQSDLIFQEVYGMTESLLTHRSPLKSIKLGSCGKLIPNTYAKIIDPQTNISVPQGERGELVMKGPGMMTCYLNNEKATSETIDSEGWIHTGDIATRSEDGYFKIVDRIKELIKVKGFQVSPSELEDILMEHPFVDEAGVVGVPDERAGELVRAYVSLKKGAKLKEDEVKKELIKLIGSRMAPYKSLTGGVRILSEIPKTQTGKIVRKELKDLVLNEQ